MKLTRKLSLLLICLALIASFALALSSCEMDIFSFGTLPEETEQPNGERPNGEQPSGEQPSDDPGEQTEPTHEHAFTETVVEPTCTEPGSRTLTCSCGETTSEEIPALGHDFAYVEGDYFLIVPCSRCDAYARLDSEHTYDEYFVYSFGEEDKAEIAALYAAAKAALAENAIPEGGEPEAFDRSSPLYQKNKDFENEYFNPYDEALTALQQQEEIAYLFFTIYDAGEGWDEIYNEISAYFEECYAEYSGLFLAIYDSALRSYFFAEEYGWTPESIAAQLEEAGQSSDPEMVALKRRANEIEVAFRVLEDPGTAKEVPGLYEELIEVQNKMATRRGYQNYADYAYANVYGRDYTPADVAAMREFVKANIGRYFFHLAYAQFFSAPKNADWMHYFSSGADASFLDSPEVVAAIAEHLKQVGSIGEKDLSFYGEASDLFKNNNFFSGAGERAFTSSLPKDRIPYLYFGQEYYSTAFTFVHEFGHYMNARYNDDHSTPMDLAEVHSQGNEMLFLYFLLDHLPEAYGASENDVSYLIVDQLVSTFATILSATAVDEFEYICYTASYAGENAKILAIVEDGKVEASEYDALYTAVLGEYDGKGLLNPTYWRYVTIHSPVYYISYAMSALPSVSIFVTAEEEGYETALAAYKKLFTYSDEESFVSVNEETDVVDANVTFRGVLEYAGIPDPFEEGLYLPIKAYIEELLGADLIAAIDGEFAA